MTNNKPALKMTPSVITLKGLSGQTRFPLRALKMSSFNSWLNGELLLTNVNLFKL